uniref:4-coumarate--CoA ligase n=1 Tax=Strigomonas oncopelti TaxID=5657 RepID=T1YTE6_STROO|nr:4-coumarate--CoA ligase [Strigomonas oncopelti]
MFRFISRTTGAATATAFGLCRSQRRHYIREEPNGQRIYCSDIPSILPQLERETTMYQHIMRSIGGAEQSKPALIQAETGEQYTYAQLPGKIEHVAEVLYGAGVRRGDVVCIALLNTIAFTPMVMGTLRLGGVVSTVNPVSDAETISHYLATNKASVIVGMKFFQKELEGAVNRVMRETNRAVTIIYPEDFMKAASPGPIPADYDALSGGALDDTIYIPFSSGTTGLPKGTQLTNRCLIANYLQATQFAKTNSPDHALKSDVSVTVLPLFHIYGFLCCLYTVLASGGTQVVMAKYTLDGFMEINHKYKATKNCVAPPILLSIVKNFDRFKKHDLSSLRFVTSGAALLDGALQEQCEKLIPNCVVGQGYGMTEMSPVVTSPTDNKSMRRTKGSNGRLLPDTEMRIIKVDASQQSGADKSAGIDVGKGEEGEIWVRGPQMMKGYLNPEDTAKCMQDGWYRTGDIGKVDPATEELFITDRLKELIKYKGFQVSPASLEGVILTHPWVQDCIVIGVPDPKEASFEVPRALVQLRPDLPPKKAVEATDVIYRFIMAKEPPHRRLHGGVRVVDQIPKNATGKLMRRVARQSEIEYLKKNAY